MKASVPSPKSLGYPAEPSWAMARRDDDDVSRRYFEEEQRSQGPRGPARLARDFGDRTLGMPKLIVSSVRALEEAQACARMMSTSEPWITLGRDYQASLGILLDESRERYLVEGHSEILLRKSRGPISTYRAGNPPARV